MGSPKYIGVLISLSYVTIGMISSFGLIHLSDGVISIYSVFFIAFILGSIVSYAYARIYTEMDVEKINSFYIENGIPVIVFIFVVNFEHIWSFYHDTGYISHIPSEIVYPMFALTVFITAYGLVIKTNSSKLFIPAIISLVLAIYIITEHISSDTILSTQNPASYIITVPISIFIWFMIIFVAMAIIIDIKGIKPGDKFRQKQEMYGDPFGDKHASQILDNEDNSEKED